MTSPLLEPVDERATVLRLHLELLDEAIRRERARLTRREEPDTLTPTERLGRFTKRGGALVVDAGSGRQRAPDRRTLLRIERLAQQVVAALRRSRTLFGDLDLLVLRRHFFYSPSSMLEESSRKRSLSEFSFSITASILSRSMMSSNARVMMRVNSRGGSASTSHDSLPNFSMYALARLSVSFAGFGGGLNRLICVIVSASLRTSRFSTPNSSSRAWMSRTMSSPDGS